jgi:hypothetical protein
MAGNEKCENLRKRLFIKRILWYDKYICTF